MKRHYINFETVLDKVSEYFEAENDLRRSSAKNGCIYMRNGKTYTKAEEHIIHASKEAESLSDQIFFACTMLLMNADMRGRLWAAARALGRWYRETEYKRLPPVALINRLECFVFGNLTDD